MALAAAHVRALLRWIMLVGLGGAACEAPPARVRKTLEDSGYSDVVLTGPKFMACSDSDEYIGEGFVAANAKGSRVEGVVCCGWWKSCTVRF